MEYIGCNEAVERIVPVMGDSFFKIRRMIEEIPVLSEVQKTFYLTIMENRYNKVFLPLYRDIISSRKKHEAKVAQEKTERGRENV